MPNAFELDQLVFKFERDADTVQTDHIDWGFRVVGLYGMDYRYTTAGGWVSDQLLKHNLLYGWDPTEAVRRRVHSRVPGGNRHPRRPLDRLPGHRDPVLASDNYMGSHSILFTYDTYTQTGIMVIAEDQRPVDGPGASALRARTWLPGIQGHP